VGGFQFSVSGINITGASGGSATDAGFMVSANGTMVLGFSLTGATIPAGSGVLTSLTFDNTGDDICFTAATISDGGGDPIENETGPCNGEGGGGDGGEVIEGCTDASACNFDEAANFDDGSCEWDSCSGCMDMGAINYDPSATIPCDECCDYEPASFNVYRDGLLIASDVETFSFVDGGLNPATEYCYVVELVDGGEVVDTSNEACATTDDGPILGCTDENACNYDETAQEDDGSCWSPNAGCVCEDGLDAVCIQHFTNLPIATGATSLVIIQNIDGLEVGDEVGLFDSNGLLNYNDCATEYGELLVGAGVWTGSQLNLVGIGSVDMCAFGGVQLAGYVEGNPIKYKVWKVADDTEYDAEATYAAGNGTWGDIITSVSLLEPIFSITQELVHHLWWHMLRLKYPQLHHHLLVQPHNNIQW